MGIGMTIGKLSVQMRIAAEASRNLATLALDDRFSDTLGDGQGADLCDVVYHSPEDSATAATHIVAGGNSDFALDDDSLHIFSGNDISLVRVKTIKLENMGSVNVRIDGLGFAGEVRPNGCFMVHAPDATAYVAAGATIRIHNESTTAEARFKLTLVGEAVSAGISSSSSSSSTSSSNSSSSTSSSSSRSASSRSPSSRSASDSSSTAGASASSVSSSSS